MKQLHNLPRVSTLAVPLAVMPLVFLLMAAAPPAAADWLVTTSGAQIQTDGSWEVKERLIVFRQADGTLASLRATKVDLDASARLTEERSRPVVVPPPIPKPEYEGPRLVLTDDDVARYVPPPSETDEAVEEDGDGDAAPAPPAGSQNLNVSGWQLDDSYDGSGLRIIGTLTNGTREVAASLSLVVVAYDSDGTEMGTSEAVLSATTLPPGERTRFRAEFSNLANFTSIRFRPFAAQSFATTGAAASGGGGETNSEEAVPE